MILLLKQVDNLLLFSILNSTSHWIKKKKKVAYRFKKQCQLEEVKMSPIKYSDKLFFHIFEVTKEHMRVNYPNKLEEKLSWYLGSQME